MQRAAVARIPNIAIIIKIIVLEIDVSGSRIERRIMPYPPSFRRVPARTIDPAIGASTWAFGSHR